MSEDQPPCQATAPSPATPKKAGGLPKPVLIGGLVALGVALVGGYALWSSHVEQQAAALVATLPSQQEQEAADKAAAAAREEALREFNADVVNIERNLDDLEKLMSRKKYKLDEVKRLANLAGDPLARWGRRFAAWNPVDRNEHSGVMLRLSFLQRRYTRLLEPVLEKHGAAISAADGESSGSAPAVPGRPKPNCDELKREAAEISETCSREASASLDCNDKYTAGTQRDACRFPHDQALETAKRRWGALQTVIKSSSNCPVWSFGTSCR